MEKSFPASSLANFCTPIDANLATESQNQVEHGSDSRVVTEEAGDLKFYCDVVYKRRGNAHGMNYAFEDKEGWTPVIRKRRSKVSSRLIRMKAPPHVSTDSDADSDISKYSLDILADANVQY